MATFEIWIEGYAATGEHGIAQHLGTYQGETFPEACQAAMKDKEWDMEYYNPANNSYWACRFYDNEPDARKSFG